MYYFKTSSTSCLETFLYVSQSVFTSILDLAKLLMSKTDFHKSLKPVAHNRPTNLAAKNTGISFHTLSQPKNYRLKYAKRRFFYRFFMYVYIASLALIALYLFCSIYNFMWVISPKVGVLSKFLDGCHRQKDSYTEKADKRNKKKGPSIRLKLYFKVRKFTNEFHWYIF